MTIKNVSKRASKATYLLSVASEGLESLLYELKGDENLKLLLDNLSLLDEAKREMIKILAQDNKLTELED